MKTITLILITGLMIANMAILAQSHSKDDPDIAWELIVDGTDSILSITGPGAMPDYGYNGAPWAIYPDVRTISISEGITRIGENAFSSFFYLQNMIVAWEDPDDIVYPDIISSIFGNVQVDLASLHVPAGSELLYERHQLWSSFNINCSTKGTFDQITWTVEDGILTIGGTGDLPDYEYARAPWSCNAGITHIIIGNGITRIGENNFATCPGLEEMTVAWPDPNDIAYISTQAPPIFANVDITTVTLNVPEGSENLYLSHDLWKQFIIDYCPTAGTIGNIVWNIENTTLTISGQGALDDYEYGKAPWSCNPDVTSIVIGEGITRIGNTVFASFFDLEEMTVAWPDPNEIVYGNGSIFGNVRIDEVTLHVPEGTEALYYYHELWGLFIIDYCPTEGTIDNIEWNAEDGTLSILGDGSLPDYRQNTAPWICHADITCIIIDKRINRIGIYNFSSLTNLQNVVVSWENPYIITYGNIDDIFAQVDISSVELHVPAGSENFYRGHPLWRRFIINDVTAGDIENIQWHLEYGTLFISGEGEIPDSHFYPWFNFHFNIHELKILDNVTGLNRESFHTLEDVTAISIAKSVTRISHHVFHEMRNIADITLFWEDPHAVMYEGEIFNMYEIDTGNIIVHVPYGKKEEYESHYIWDQFTIVDNVQSDIGIENISETSAAITWDDIPGASEYIIDIYSDAALTNVIATDTLPSSSKRPGSEKEAGFIFNVQDLAENTRYFYAIESFDSENTTLTHTEGSFKTLGELGIGSVTRKPINIYPNPATDVITIEGIGNGATIRIFDVSGREVLATTHTTIYVGALSKGIYIISSDKYTGKFIVK